MGVSSRKRWDFAKEIESPIHKIHSYPARFPAFIVTEAIKYAEERGVRVQSVADVFCGCGTTAVESRASNKDFWGWDVNPVAVLITRVKCRRYKDEVLAENFADIVYTFSTMDLSGEEVDGVNERIKYWFDRDHIRDLLKLKKAIDKTSMPYKNFFLCAFSNILKPTSRWLSKSIKPQIDPDKRPSNTLEAFENQFNRMRKANMEKISGNNIKSRVKVNTANFLAIRRKEPFVDLIVTSPPYVTSYDYADLHQLSLLWLGFVNHYQELRKDMIGNRYGLDEVLGSEISELPASTQVTLSRLEKKDRHKANSVAKYFCDMEKGVFNCWNILKRNGMAVFVIGNTEYRGVGINNAEYLSQCMKKAGFESVRKINRKMSMKTLTPYRDSIGRFTKSDGQRQVYAKEFIVIGRKR